MRYRIESLTRRALGRTPPFILMYHRVADVAHDPWALAVSPRHFAEQIELVMRLRRPVPLAELANGRAPEEAIAITFDDGYIDTLVHAKPILEKYGCPATVFIPTRLIGDGGFWWDELARLIFESPELPHRLTIETSAGRLFAWKNDDPGARSRQALHDGLWSWLLPLPNELRRDCLRQLARQIGAPPAAREDDRPMTAEEVRGLSNDLIEIGAHTATHPAMAMLSVEEKRSEVIESQRACEALLGRPARSFAYPHGSYDRESVAAVREAGFSVACTTAFGPVTRRCRELELPRIQVKNWDGEMFRRRLHRHFIEPSRFERMLSNRLRWDSRAVAS